MRVAADRRVDAYAAAVGGLQEVETDPDKRAKYLEFIDTYAGLDEDERMRFERDYPKESKAMTGMIQRARDEGWQEGRQEGRHEGERAVLERLLRRRFGLLSPAVAERLRRASAGEIEAWADNVLDADTLDEVFRPGPA